jgi:hypothetical protein
LGCVERKAGNAVAAVRALPAREPSQLHPRFAFLEDRIVTGANTHTERIEAEARRAAEQLAEHKRKAENEKKRQAENNNEYWWRKVETNTICHGLLPKYNQEREAEKILQRR